MTCLRINKWDRSTSANHFDHVGPRADVKHASTIILSDKPASCSVVLNNLTNNSACEKHRTRSSHRFDNKASFHRKETFFRRFSRHYPDFRQGMAQKAIV